MTKHQLATVDAAASADAAGLNATCAGMLKAVSKLRNAFGVISIEISSVYRAAYRRQALAALRELRDEISSLIAVIEQDQSREPNSN